MNALQADAGDVVFTYLLYFRQSTAGDDNRAVVRVLRKTLLPRV